MRLVHALPLTVVVVAGCSSGAIVALPKPVVPLATAAPSASLGQSGSGIIPSPAVTSTAVPTAVPTAAPSTAPPTPTPSPSPTPIPSVVPFAAGLALANANPADPNFGALTLPFGTLGAAATVTLAPAGAPFSVTLDPATCGSGTAAIVSVTQPASGAFTVTALNAGFCKAVISSPSATATILWFTVSQTGFSLS